VLLIATWRKRALAKAAAAKGQKYLSSM